MIIDLEESNRLKEDNEHLNNYLKKMGKVHRLRYEIMKKIDSLIIDLLSLRFSPDLELSFSNLTKEIINLKEMMEKERHD